MDQSITIRARAIVLGVVVFFSIAFVELVLRIYNPIYIPLRANKIVLPVNNEFVVENTNNTKTDSKVVTRYNSLGFRGPDLPEKFTEYLSIVTIGGSTTACVALTEGKTWPDLVGKHLGNQFSNFWLNNAGFDGHSTFGHIQLLNQAISDLKPDYALFLVGVNDIGRKDLNEFDANQHVGNLSLRNKIIAASELLSTLQVVSRTFRAIQLEANHHPDFDFAAIETVNTPIEVIGELLDRHTTEFLPGYRARLQHIVELSRSFGTEPVLMTQPALWGDGIDPTLNIDIGPRKFKDNINSAARWKIMDLYNDVTRQVAIENDVSLVDLAVLMPKDSQYFYDWVHYSVAGAQKMSEIISDQLLKIFKL